MINRVILLGHLGADAEVRNTSTGKPVMNFRMATTEKWKDRNGERQERTEWSSVVCMNEQMINAISRYLTKGQMVYVEGKMQTRKWTDQNGNDRYTTEVMVGPGGEIRLIGGGGRDNAERDDRGDGRDRTRGQGRNDGRGWGGGRGGRGRDDMESDIPF